MLSAELFRDRRSQLAKVVLLLCGVYFALAFAGQAWKAKGLSETLAEERAALARQEAATEKLRERLAFLNGPGYDAYVERVARSELGFIRPGDRAVFVVPRPKAAPVVPEAPLRESDPAPAAEPRVPAWKQWAEVFLP